MASIQSDQRTMQSVRSHQSDQLTMQSVRRSEIPQYLQCGELFKTLSENNDDSDEGMDFPSSALKPDPSVTNVNECDHLLNSLRFWGVDAFCSEILDFSLRNSCVVDEETDSVLADYELNFEYVAVIRKIGNSHSLVKPLVALQSGFLEILKFVVHHGYRLPMSAGTVAAIMGRADLMIYAHKQGCHADTNTVNTVAARGWFDELKYLSDYGCTFTPSTEAFAAQGGNLQCLQLVEQKLAGYYYWSNGGYYYWSNGGYYYFPRWYETPYNSCTWERAAARGHLNILRYIYARPGPRHWDHHTCRAAAAGGHFDCLVFLHEHGCVWTATTCEAAAAGGHLNCLQYAHKHGCELFFVKLRQSNPCFEYVMKNGMKRTYEDDYVFQQF